MGERRRETGGRRRVVDGAPIQAEERTMGRSIVCCLVLALGCGGDDDGSSNDGSRADARPVIDASEESDAAAPDGAPEPVCPELDPGAGDGFESCNPLTHEGCAADQKCAWLVVDDDPFLGRTDCVPDGTVAIGETCTEGDPGETTGYDDCARGGICTSDRCHAVCNYDSDSCCQGFACSFYSGMFSDDTADNTGQCDQLCDPVAQDCAFEGEGCYLQLSSGKATCARPAAGAEELTQGETCVNGGGLCFLNGCAEGYGAFLYAGTGVPRDCTAFCSPVDTYIVDPDGDGTGELVAGGDADGAAPTDCSEARIGFPGHQCRFFQSYFVDQNSEYLDYVSDTYGFCAPRGRAFGNCKRYSEEWFYEEYNQFIEGGGTPEDWYLEIEALCDATPARCAFGCMKVATKDALAAAYCAVPANMDRPSCAAGLQGARVVRRSLERYHAERLVRTGAAGD
jgi:hypothetical protein